MNRVNPRCTVHFNQPFYQEPTGDDLIMFIKKHRRKIGGGDTSHSCDKRLAKIMGYNDGAAIRRLKKSRRIQRQAWWILMLWLEEQEK